MRAVAGPRSRIAPLSRCDTAARVHPLPLWMAGCIKRAGRALWGCAIVVEQDLLAALAGDDLVRAALLAASRTGDGPFDAAMQVFGALTDPYADVGFAAIDDAGNASLGWNGEDANSGTLAIRLATRKPTAARRVSDPLGAPFASGELVGVALAAGRGLGVAILPSGVPRLLAVDDKDA
jgi:hypothetical protein